MDNKIKKYRVSRSLNPTNRIIAKRARDSSGPVPLYDYYKVLEYLNVLFIDDKYGGWGR